MTTQTQTRTGVRLSWQSKQAEASQAAARIWESMTDNERCGVRFGLFPAAKMEAKEVKHIESRLLSVALMEIAEKNGGMRA